ncbi:hypothetical protein [Enterococcus pallens]|uniref:Uncharacterized protein n=1 Tax=Enterococcus pallens ATCC BAA-351 TaxID=1158607 RepID=R2SRU6_9ENTE|nr:hypothetical protein [Enterococcus pallens]EOH90839.1 hypothetical protein UAU_03378 [Enterococcus pallens ATCC BAA-351]EOU16035.1 hypothetical protein I588_03691 [Enterococcus pallens ATCC BAA-351]
MEYLKKVFSKDNLVRFLNLVLKISPVLISLCALIFSINSYIDSKFSAPLSYHISTENKYVDKIVLDGKTLQGTKPRIIRSSGFIDKTSVIMYTNKEYIKISEFPTMNFSDDLNFFQKLKLNELTTSAGAEELNSLYANEEEKKYYAYYFLLIEGMDKSKHLHMITHYYDEGKNEMLTKNYSEKTILSPEKKEYQQAFLGAKEDFFSLKEDLESNNLL